MIKPALQNLPTVSICIPVYNASRTLERCLEFIANQDYPKDKIEYILADGGSTDKTVEIAKKYGEVYPNPLKTGEAGKAVAVKKAKNEIVALIDSDNILTDENWLKKMVEPFSDPEVFGSEPIEYVYDRREGYITRYSALMGMNDPLVYFTGNYDRYNYISKKWTRSPVEIEDKGSWLKIGLDPKHLPTIGANGTMVRRDLLVKQLGKRDYLFDIDIIYEILNCQLMINGKNQIALTRSFAKVRVGILHLFSGSMSTFIRKQKRRVNDFMYYDKQKIRTYPWGGVSKIGLLKFILSCLLIIPLLWQSLIGYLKKPDPVWWLHPIFCWITLWVYGIGYLSGKVRPRIADRSQWSQ